MLLLGIQKKNFYISTRHEEKFSGFILSNIALHNFIRCNAKHIV
jgi:hypothetical protein